MKILIDSNVLISALATQGMAQRSFRLALEYHEIFISHYIMNEVEAALAKKFKFPAEECQTAVKYLKKVCALIRTRGAAIPMIRDGKDDPILQAAEQAKVDILMTGDKDLLEVKLKLPFRILNPRAFVELHAAR